MGRIGVQRQRLYRRRICPGHAGGRRDHQGGAGDGYPGGARSRPVGEIDNIDARLALPQANSHSAGPSAGCAARRHRLRLGRPDLRPAKPNSSRPGARDPGGGRLQAGQLDLGRRRALADLGSVSGEELSNAEIVFAIARATLEAAKPAAAEAKAGRASAVGSRTSTPP